jgi:hypothetical protein
MNERIRELAEQSMGTRKHVPPVWQFFDDELKKFAELIVKECAHVALMSNGNNLHVFTLIKQHFGVEE